MTAEVSGLRWYVVQTQPHAEKKASEHLVRQGFAAYLPCYQKRRRHARRVEVVSTPLFSRYLFIAMDVNVQRWRSIRSTIGVSQIVSRGDVPIPISDEVIAQIKAREDESGFVRLDARPRFIRGEPIRILDGAFSSCHGLFEAVTDVARVTVLLEFLGRKVRVVLEEDMVAAA
jgi:transcriptional antiterminator RfaH